MVEKSKPPTTTTQQDKTLEGQRAINAVWEATQSRIALIVVVSGVITNDIVILGVFLLFMYIPGRELSGNQVALLLATVSSMSTLLGMVIGFYFSRTNHSAIGGVGHKATEDEEYKGR